MKNALAIAGIVSVAVGTLCGAVNWLLVEHVLEAADWSEPLVQLNSLLWLASVLAFGLGGVLIGIATMMNNRAPVRDPRAAERWR